MKRIYISLSVITMISFFIKLIIIIKYNNQLTLSSDDLNYIKSAAILIEKNIFTFFEVNQPTVFVTPVYPVFLAGVFKIFQVNLMGLQAVRILQAIISSFTIVIVFLSCKKIFNPKVALLSAFLTAFYIPNIVTVGYLLTETLFSFIFMLLIYFSIKYIENPNYKGVFILGILWAITSLLRPVAALYPVLLLIHVLLNRKMRVASILKYGLVMTVVFTVFMSPWWVRNFIYYKEFIPLSAASGNPMLQGTYIDYIQANPTYYKMGKNSFETNKVEVNLSKARIKDGFSRNFWQYLHWYTLGKSKWFWGTVFYWKDILNIGFIKVTLFHFILLLGFAGIIALKWHIILKNSIWILSILYFNFVHCVYMAFDRYAFPILPILSMFSAYFIFGIYSILKKDIYLLLNISN